MRITSGIVNGAIVALWVVLFAPIYDNLAVIFTREDFRTSQIALIGALILIAFRLKRRPFHFRIDTPIHTYPPAIALALGGSILFVAVERFLDINTLAMMLFGLATYGLLGLWMAPRAWRAGFPAALLLIGVLPLGDFLDVFIGYPMRIATATLVRDGLTAAGVSSIGVDTVLVFENGISQIDLPCSGVKSLWTGMLFLLAATWIERRPLNLRWLWAAAVFTALLFVANLARVAVLVSVGEVLNLRFVAQLIHVPLGILGFVAVCAAGVWLMRLIPRTHTDAPESVEAPQPRVWPSVALALALIVLNLFNSPRPLLALTDATSQPWTLNAVSEFNMAPVQLRPGEVDWLLRDGAESVTRTRFNWRGITGSLMLVPSRNWRAHHNPERCLENDGLRTEQAATHWVQGDLSVKLLTLTQGQSGAPERRLSAIYWFQSAERTTDDYGTRLWSALSLNPERWVLVSILFDSVHDVRSGELAASPVQMDALVIALHDTVDAQFKAAPRK